MSINDKKRLDKKINAEIVKQINHMDNGKYKVTGNIYKWRMKHPRAWLKGFKKAGKYLTHTGFRYDTAVNRDKANYRKLKGTSNTYHHKSADDYLKDAKNKSSLFNESALMLSRMKKRKKAYKDRLNKIRQRDDNGPKSGSDSGFSSSDDKSSDSASQSGSKASSASSMSSSSSNSSKSKASFKSSEKSPREKAGEFGPFHHKFWNRRFNDLRRVSAYGHHKWQHHKYNKHTRKATIQDAKARNARQNLRDENKQQFTGHTYTGRYAIRGAKVSQHDANGTADKFMTSFHNGKARLYQSVAHDKFFTWLNNRVNPLNYLMMGVRFIKNTVMMHYHYARSAHHHNKAHKYERVIQYRENHGLRRNKYNVHLLNRLHHSNKMNDTYKKELNDKKKELNGKSKQQSEDLER